MNNALKIDGMAGAFVAGMHEAVGVEAANADNGLSPVMNTALTATVDLAADCLTDAEVTREDIITFGGISRAERIIIRFPDQSAVTAIAAWGEDQVDFVPGAVSDDRWYAMTDQRVSLNP